MNKSQALEDILHQLNLVEYRQDTAKYVRVGPYKIDEGDNNDWQVNGQGISAQFSTRTAALGYAKCIMNKDFETATKIIMLDHQLAQKSAHEASILNALKKNNAMEAKLQQAQDQRRANMNELTSLVLNIL